MIHARCVLDLLRTMVRYAALSSIVGRFTITEAVAVAEPELRARGARLGWSTLGIADDRLPGSSMVGISAASG